MEQMIDGDEALDMPRSIGLPAGGDVPIKVFVHLAQDKDAEAWRKAWEAGTMVGVNDRTPYGYGRATAMGCEITFSRSGPEGPPSKFIRLALRVLLGFDYLHARRQRERMAEADIVWTHTESQYLAVAAVMGGRPNRPKLLGQSVWLFDHWPTLSWLQRTLYRRLIRHVDILTVHSDENLAVLQELFPGKRSALVRFGIPSEASTPPRCRAANPIRILSVGSDRHRDWQTLIDAVCGQENMILEILSWTAKPSLVRDLPNATIKPARNSAALNSALAEATLICVPLMPNKHASGITVIQEAVLAGLPVIATATGGLPGYFPADAVRYVPPGDVAALREAIRATASDAETALSRARRAQARMRDGILGAETFIRRHVEISRELLAR